MFRILNNSELRHDKQGFTPCILDFIGCEQFLKLRPPHLIRLFFGLTLTAFHPLLGCLVNVEQIFKAALLFCRRHGEKCHDAFLAVERRLFWNLLFNFLDIRHDFLRQYIVITHLLNISNLYFQCPVRIVPGFYHIIHGIGIKDGICLKRPIGMQSEYGFLSGLALKKPERI